MSDFATELLAALSDPDVVEGSRLWKVSKEFVDTLHTVTGLGAGLLRGKESFNIAVWAPYRVDGATYKHVLNIPAEGILLWKESDFKNVLLGWWRNNVPNRATKEWSELHSMVQAMQKPVKITFMIEKGKLLRTVSLEAPALETLLKTPAGVLFPVPEEIRFNASDLNDVHDVDVNLGNVKFKAQVVEGKVYLVHDGNLKDSYENQMTYVAGRG
jgi:hypothetical protein